ncbi:MAG: recombinase family protein [Oscillospiraceae bacterium]|nr:recombinase family protein [Oscillospiraceae bacterium]
MNKYGYIRVSTTEQCTDRQLIAMTELKIPKENIYIDKLSGKNTARPDLQKLLSAVKRGDTVVVESVSRFARNTRDLLDLIEKLTSKGVDFVSQKENIDTSTPTGKFMLTVFGAVAELERGYILQRQAEGIAAAKLRGVKFGRPVKKPPENFAEIVRQWKRGEIMTKTALELTGLTESTFYRRVREYRAVKKK